MTIPPQSPEDMGWDVDVVIPPNDALFTLDLVTSDPPTLALSVDGEDEVINLVLGADGPRGPTGPAGGPVGATGPTGPPGTPGVLVLGAAAPVPPGTPAGTVILRTAT